MLPEEKSGSLRTVSGRQAVTQRLEPIQPLLVYLRAPSLASASTLLPLLVQYRAGSLLDSRILRRQASLSGGNTMKGIIVNGAIVAEPAPYNPQDLSRVLHETTGLSFSFPEVESVDAFSFSAIVANAVEVDAPAYDPATQAAIGSWEVVGSEIHRKWEVTDLPTAPVVDLTPADVAS